MPSNLKFSVVWEDPCGAKGDELRATWCRLSIQIGDTPVTRVYDERAQTVRDEIYCPAYPLAEWLVFNWWPLLNEPDRQSDAGERHNLRFAREGFALPDLEFFSEESCVRAIWKSYRPIAAPVKFTEENFALLENKPFVAEIETFIRMIVARLESKGLSNTALTKEWKAIQETSNQEREFCETAGALGLDPYDLDDKTANEIIAIDKRLPLEMKREFFLAADSTALTKQANWISKCIKQLDNSKIKTQLAGKKGYYRSRLKKTLTPWENGYCFARIFRKEFDLGKPTMPISIDNLCRSGKESFPILYIGNEHKLDAVTKLSSDFGPQIATSNRWENRKGWMLARSICDYSCSDTEESTLLTRIKSDKQKLNRAFAAELLAPAEGLRQFFSNRSKISREDINDAAEFFGVSEFVVEHQVRNHDIADIEEITPLPGNP